MNAARFITLLNVAALVTMMLAMGLQVRFEAVASSLRPLHRIASGLIANYVLAPVLTVGLLYLFQARAMVSAGFLTLAVCPGAAFGPVAATIARGNVAWAVGMMMILAGSSAVLSPALVSLSMTWIAPGSNLQIDYPAVLRVLLLAQLLPLAAGLALRQWAPWLAEKAADLVYRLANVMMLVLIGAILATQYEMLAAIRIRGWTGMILLFAGSLGIGWFCGGPDLAVRRALSVTTTGRNAAVALLIVNRSFAGSEAVTAVVAYALVSILGTFVFASFLGRTADSPG